MSKKKTSPKTLKQKEVSLFKNEEEFNQLELLDELCNDEIDQYISITSRGDGKSFATKRLHQFYNFRN